MIELGKTYKDTITGFTGVATGYVTYITGCNQVLLTPKIKEDGTARESTWIDEQRAEVTDAPIVTIDNSAGAGFGPEAPIR